MLNFIINNNFYNLISNFMNFQVVVFFKYFLQKVSS